MAILLRSAGKYLPSNILTNDDLSRQIDSSDEWIRTHTGISQRRIGQISDKASDFAVKACKNALKNYNNLVKEEEIDLILVSTATPDYSSVPSTACVVQRELGTKNATAFDLSAACSGFLYALDTASALMKSHNWRYALVCGTEILSKIVDWSDRGTCILFGDGSGAVLIENDFSDENKGFSSFVLGSDGTGVDALYAGDNGKLVMDGHAVYNFAVSKMSTILTDLMEKEHLKVEDIDYFLCHQANERILSAATKRAKLPAEKVIVNLKYYGNISSACIPVTLADFMQENKITTGKTIVFAAFGAGLTWAGCVLRT